MAWPVKLPHGFILTVPGNSPKCLPHYMPICFTAHLCPKNSRRHFPRGEFDQNERLTYVFSCIQNLPNNNIATMSQRSDIIPPWTLYSTFFIDYMSQKCNLYLRTRFAWPLACIKIWYAFLVWCRWNLKSMASYKLGVRFICERRAFVNEIAGRESVARHSVKGGCHVIVTKSRPGEMIVLR